MLYHVISSTSPIEYRLDPTISSNILYFQHDGLFILLWRTRMKEKLLRDNRHTRWFEGNFAFLALLLLSCFFALRLFGHYITNEKLDLLSSETVIKQTQQVGIRFGCHVVFHTVRSVYCQYDDRVSVTEQLSKTTLSTGYGSSGGSCSEILETMTTFLLMQQTIHNV